ncbi:MULTISPECIES: hypothetical protein [unclassified Maridesulfovibrio]|uniref:hypothetical protein n=1 Tax=unclassified Maridesulfovibrio TaxID=2794999 RepID=UPI003B3F30F1
MFHSDPYHTAQQGMAMLKSSVVQLLKMHHPEGLKNSELGRALGIYMGHKGHEGHISRTILSLLEAEGTVLQSDDKKWHLSPALIYGLKVAE